MKTITQDQAFAMFTNARKVQVEKNKAVLVKQVQSEMPYVTVVANESGDLIVENKGNVSDGYLVRQIIVHNEQSYNNEYVIRTDEELHKRYDISEDQNDVETGWVRYVPKASAKKFVAFVNEFLQFPDTWSGNNFTLLDGGVLVDNGGGTVYGINPIEFYSTHSIIDTNA